MKNDDMVLEIEDRFFAALSKGDRETLAGLVDEEVVLVDVLSGSEVRRAEFVGAVGSRRLVFQSIERLGARVRRYGATAVVNGQTRMIGRFEGQPFRVHSRYTHVYVHARGGYRLVNAQGTPIVAATASSNGAAGHLED